MNLWRLAWERSRLFQGLLCQTALIKYSLSNHHSQSSAPMPWDRLGKVSMQHSNHYSGALAREARSGAPWVRKCGKLPIQENLVITWPYTERASDRPSAPQAYQCKITQSTGMATQMRLKVLFRRTNNNIVVSFSALFFMFTLTWTREKELERVIENKGD